MTDEAARLSRRAIMSGVAVAGIAVAATPAVAQQMRRPSAMPAMQDPRAKYPRPPFASQSQPWPGLASRMTPRPDHGETSYRGSGRLAGRKALITGGDSGMGRAAAIAYAREGADVAINYLPAEEPDAREVVALIRAEGRNAVAIPGDLRGEAFCRRLVEQAANRLGGLDIMVINAARQQVALDVTQLTTEEFDFHMKVNVYAMFWMTKYGVPLMRPGSSIIVTASEQAYDPSADIAHYALTKAANVSWVKSMAKQLADRGIRVNGVAPGPIWTPLQVSGGAKREKLVSFGGDTPLKRPGQPAELAGIYVRLAEDDSSYTTGSVYGAAGGPTGG